MNSNQNKLSQFVCTRPFDTVEIRYDGTYACCWSKFPLTTADDVEEMKESVSNGSYSLCDKKHCPSLNKLIGTGEVDYQIFAPIEDLGKINITNIIVAYLNFDQSCNLECPSCRTEIILNNDSLIPILNTTLHEFELTYASTLKRINLSGSGDPLFSKVFRNYLINFDANKYPTLNGITLITNGLLLTEKMWNSLNARHFIDEIRISLDAGTKLTYENITRLRGNWDQLLDNIRFLITTSVQRIEFSMVVSELNFNEMRIMYDVISQITKGSGKNVFFTYRKIDNWGTYDKLAFRKLQVFDPSHPTFPKFVIELNKVCNESNVDHNFHHLL